MKSIDDIRPADILMLDRIIEAYRAARSAGRSQASLSLDALLRRELSAFLSDHQASLAFLMVDTHGYDARLAFQSVLPDE